MTKALTCLLIMLLAILPDLSSSRVRNKRVKRGVTQLGKVAEIPPDAKAEAKRMYADYQSWAVLPFHQIGRAEVSLDGVSVAFAVHDDLQYASSILVTDMATTLDYMGREQLLAAPLASAAEKLSKLAGDLQVQYVLDGSCETEGDQWQLSAQLMHVENEVVTAVAQAQVRGPSEKFFELADQLLEELLEPVNVAFTHPAETRTVPTQNVTARRRCDQGFLDIYRAAGRARGNADALNRAALQHAEAALKEDPSYLRAYILQASALENLGREQSLKDCLRAGMRHNASSPADKLTKLEFEGDYLRFFRGLDKLGDALEKYEEMLAISPGHLRGLWSMIECILAETDLPPSPDDLADASHFAARVVVGHPASVMASFLESPPPDEDE